MQLLFSVCVCVCEREKEREREREREREKSKIRYARQQVCEFSPTSRAPTQQIIITSVHPKFNCTVAGYMHANALSTSQHRINDTV